MQTTSKKLIILYRSKKTVFTINEIVLYWGLGVTKESAVRLISYYVSVGLLYPIRRGIYAKTKDYNRRELAMRILVPCYISFDTVLCDAGIIVRNNNRIEVATYTTRQITIEHQTITYRRLPWGILATPFGIKHDEIGCSTASPERAFLDTVYTHVTYHFDNLAPLDWSKVEDLMHIYEPHRAKRMFASLKKYKVQHDLDTQKQLHKR